MYNKPLARLHKQTDLPDHGMQLSHFEHWIVLVIAIRFMYKK